MFGRFLPKEVGFFDLFEKHGAVLSECCRVFRSMMEPTANLEVRIQRMKDLEHEADVITHQCVEALHKTFITPIERDDIHLLITRMDDIVDALDEASERVKLYEIAEFTPEMLELADLLVRAGAEIQTALRGLRNMKNARPVMQACADINGIENMGDTIYQRAVARLFKEQKDQIQIIKLKEIYEELENALDRCEDVANIIDGVVLENA